jgi:hypothetical protein
MAENISQKQLELEKQRLVELQKQLKATKDLTDAQKQQLTETARAIKATDKRIAQAKKKFELQKLENKEFESFARKFRGMSQDVQKQLQGTSKGAAVYLSLGRSISKEKAIQAKYADKEDANSQRLLANSYERESVMSDIAANAAAQAKATQKAEDELRGVSDVEREILDIQNSKGVYNAVQKKQLIEQLNQTEQLRLKEERLKTIKEEQKELFEALPESVKGAVGFAQKLGSALTSGALPMVLIASLALATLTSFTALDTAAKDFRTETGLTNSQMEGIKSDANEIVGEFANLGIEAKNVFDTVSALKSEFSDTVDFSKETVAALTVMNTNFGVAAEDAAKVQGIMEQVGGLSSETAASVGMQVVQLAKAAKVAPAKVMKDIAENAEAASTFFKGNVELLAKQAVEARRLGTNLTEVTKTAERLLDFEGSIEDELVAATFVGGQFNLSQARALAIQGDLVGAQKETLKQIQRSGDFRKQDYHTQLQLAKASGLSVAEINKQLDTQDKLSKLKKEDREAAEKAIEQGLDITNINADQLAQETEKFAAQQEMQGQVDKLSNAFQGISATIGSSLTPLLEGLIPIVSFLLLPVQAIATGFSLIVGYLKENIPLLVTLGTLAGAYYAKSIAGAVANIWSKIVGTLGPFGIPVAIAATIGAVAMAKNAMSSAQVGDMSSPADGKTVVSTKEGGLFELSPNDDLVAAPGAASALAGGGDGSSNTINVDFSILSAPLNAMINEIKALRADMASGKIAVYMDTEKVTSKIGRQVDSSTRNNFNLGQA